ncbi:MAG: hypothetical protein AAB270_06845 [Chloroflexota bacterium]
MTEKVETGLKWALPEGLEVPPDELRVRVDIYDETIVLHQFGRDGTQTRVVSALDISRAFAQELRLGSGLLPQGALWWASGPEGQEVALWRPPQVWKVALVVEVFQPPRRFTLPMPGLVFVCSPGRQPRVYAAKRRPASLGSPLYHAPLFNVFQDGRTCAGTHRYPEKVEEIPESFFMSFFTREGQSQGRSKKHPTNLLKLWEELDGKARYLLRDMVFLGTVEQVMGVK